ncbi:alpha/beta hydrolase [Reinekea marinisedimentorum]|uniref:Alpha/beta hydrolase family protein n=1 Tax=Reinekea marinisedimentorum TaxID=230495 RepID=A0A4R3I3Z5_9GAMM|nr:alpha/beta hydrolase [Reinekea marinisedimentorum]TCS39783.1 alpha/beta hydrolase family protein [Reinekea marinisedimentorum]
MLTKEKSFTVFKEKYGAEKYQEGDLYLPNLTARAIICLFHGGYWRMPYSREQLDSVAEALVTQGFVVWNIEYRRVGSKGGGWPGTFDDSIQALNYLQKVKRDHPELELLDIVLMGHSAGGHLALWCGKPNQASSQYALKIKPNVVIGLAPIANLEVAFDAQSGNQAVLNLMQGAPCDLHECYSG